MALLINTTVILFPGVPVTAGELQHKEVLLYEVRRCSMPPKIDGILDDVCWKDLPVVANFRTGLYSFGKPDIEHRLAKRQTRARICYDEKNLYIGIDLQEPHPERVIATVTTHDGPIWNDDCVEIFVEPGCIRKRYYLFSTNFLNTRRDAYWEYRYDNFIVEDKWGVNTQWYSRCSKGKDAWYIEVVIPFTDMDVTHVPRPGSLWSFQIVRLCRTLLEGRSSNLYDSRTFEYSSWTPGGNFKEPDKFGFLCFSSCFSEIERLVTEKLSKVMGTILLRFPGIKGEFVYTDYKHGMAECVSNVEDAVRGLKMLFTERSAHFDKEVLERLKGHISQFESNADRFIRSPSPVTFVSDAQKLINRAETIAMEIRVAELSQNLEKAPRGGK